MRFKLTIASIVITCVLLAVPTLLVFAENPIVEPVTGSIQTITPLTDPITGDVTVAENVTLIIDGQISGDLILKNASIYFVIFFYFKYLAIKMENIFG